MEAAVEFLDNTMKEMKMMKQTKEHARQVAFAIMMIVQLMQE